MAKVLVTGGSGFIGSHLIDALVAQGEEVTCLVRTTSRLDRLRPLGVRLVSGDVTDQDSLPAAIEGQQIVYHVAGCTRAVYTRQYYQINGQGIRNVAQSCAEQQPTPPVLVIVSSLAAAGPATDARPRTEADPLVQVSHYGRSKRAGELAAERLADRVPTTIVRPPIVLGEGDRMGLNMFRMVARFGLHMVPGLGRHRFSLIHADDLVELLILAARRGTRLEPNAEDGSSSPRGYYFAACDEHPTYAELGRMVAAALGRRRVLVLPTPKRTVWVVGAVAEVVSRIRRRPLYLNLDRAREAAAGSWRCSSQAAIDELGFSVAAPLADRLRQTAQWYRREGWL